eukprot:988054-Lingulodinium_polyedra.AAC.1
MPHLQRGCAPQEHLISKGHRKKLEQFASLCASKGAEWPLCYRNAGPVAHAYWNLKPHVGAMGFHELPAADRA